MAKKNFYAVKVGKTPGIYRTWAECKSQTEGVSGAMFKGFATEEEAKLFMGIEMTENGGTTDVDNEPGRTLQEGEALAYVDGSYNVDTGEYSCGVVFFYEGTQKNFCKKGENEELASMRNVAGEILGARMAMEEAVRCGAGKLTIVHDYQGIASWCTGEWKTNKEGTKAYKAYFDSLQGLLSIRFEKVKGHSGDTYNDLADELAKSVIFENDSSSDHKNTFGN